MRRLLYALLIVISVVFFDQITKHLVIKYISPLDSIEIFPFLHLVNVRNTGAAFGILRDLGSNFFIIISIAAIIFVTYLIIKNAYNNTGLSLLLGGAIGNLTDRLIHGQVIDFIDFSVGDFHWPAFNIADSALTIGIGIILLISLFKKGR
ncbi:MAG: signal peptidase II [Nitrospirae bacterium]|jgi:signal peptidase II|nr:signal peptidase II [Nitrospirota bacterium]